MRMFIIFYKFNLIKVRAISTLAYYFFFLFDIKINCFYFLEHFQLRVLNTLHSWKSFHNQRNWILSNVKCLKEIFHSKLCAWCSDACWINVKILCVSEKKKWEKTWISERQEISRNENQKTISTFEHKTKRERIIKQTKTWKKTTIKKKLMRKRSKWAYKPHNAMSVTSFQRS